jgi:hypothetical protein
MSIFNLLTFHKLNSLYIAILHGHLMAFDPVKENEERRACYGCDKADKCPYFQHYKTFGLLRLWGQARPLRMCR